MDFDLLPQSSLFHIVSKRLESNKSLLVSEVSNFLIWQKDLGLITHVIVDFMSKVSWTEMNQFKTLSVSCERTISLALKLDPEHLLVHVAFDSYVAQFFKECERSKQTKSSNV